MTLSNTAQYPTPIILKRKAMKDSDDHLQVIKPATVQQSHVPVLQMPTKPSSHPSAIPGLVQLTSTVMGEAEGRR